MSGTTIGMKKALYLGIISAAVLVLAGCNYSLSKNNQSSKASGIGTDAARAKVENLIKDSGGNATVEEATEDGDLYKVVISANGQEQPVYVTKDGTKFIQQAISFEDIEKQKAEAKKQEEEASKPVEKSDKPEVNLYVMSFCPYGNKAEDTLKPVYNLLKDKVDFNFRYIVTVNGDKVQSLHGQPEVDQNEREACVLKNYGKDKWINFVTYVNANCGSDGACWKAGVKSLGIDAGKINSCVDSEGTALMKADAEASNAAGASGSPTMTINGVNSKAVYQYGNPEAYKQAICGAFNNPPSECSKELSSQASTTQGGSCGS